MNESKLPKNARILIVRLSAIGDVLHSTSVVHNLKRLCPSCHITWLVSPPASLLLEGNPDIDRLLVWDRRPFDDAARHLDVRRLYHALKEARRLLAPYTFDIALDIQGLFLSGLLTHMSYAPRRIGIHERHEGNFLFMTEMAPDIPDRHKIRRYMTALYPLGIEAGDFRPGLVLNLPEEAIHFAQTLLAKHGIVSHNPARPLLLVNVRTTWPDKNWPPEYFGRTLSDLPSDIQIVFTGAPADAPYIEIAQRTMGSRPSLSLAGRTNLLQLAGVFHEADLLLTGDTGPLYIAEAVGLPTLSLWGPTHPDIYGPLTKGHHFILTPNDCHACCKTKCRHKTNACMNAIEPSVVKTALLNLLEHPTGKA
ncbi:glycosyltransferase family 9 protein [uncultured Mitsuokella sp.]|uniref:glycosyltransferase family 9 protein n=1 Tax=uncultured Mitsuokella sp. TaxID=453120 RepID=UPI0026DDAB51|nr:glycosyltransferase family 9 protein [uncultured Mitsuokella sp.]